MARLSPAEIMAVARAAGFTSAKSVAGYPLDVLFTAIALAESGGDTDIVNSIGATGLWQINAPVHKDKYGKEFQARNQNDLKNPRLNAQAAWVVSNHGTNPTPWTAYTNGSYLRHIGTAQKARAKAGTIDPITIGTLTGTSPITEGAGITAALQDWGWRIALFVGGGIAIIVALLVLTGSSKSVQGALKQLPAGKALKAVT